MTAIDNLGLQRLDFIKIDIEGMEMEALLGAEKSIGAYRPQLMIEKIKSNEGDICRFLERFDYKIFPFGINLVAVHHDDPVARQLSKLNFEQQ
jgi:hypothetical protein